MQKKNLVKKLTSAVGGCNYLQISSKFRMTGTLRLNVPNISKISEIRVNLS